MEEFIRIFLIIGWTIFPGSYLLAAILTFFDVSLSHMTLIIIQLPVYGLIYLNQLNKEKQSEKKDDEK